MTRENKVKVLQAVDILFDVRDKWKGNRGGGFKCGECGTIAASGKSHTDECRVGKAIKALLEFVPAYFDREKWLAEND